jgi:hypothetical protein
MTLQEKYIAIQEGTFPKSQFKRDAVLTLPNLVTTFNTYEEVVTILKNKGILTEVLNEYGTSDYFNEYEDAVKYAEDISSREGVVQHVNELPDGSYKVSDWYDSDTTVISFENGMQLNEEEAEKPKRKILPNKNKFTSDTITIKSALERIIQKAWAEPVLEKAKTIVLDFINTSRINDNSKKTMISNIESINNKPRLDSYLANALLAFEKLKVNEELLKYKETKVSKYGTTLTAPEDSYSFEDVQRGVDYELESMGYDSASPETFTEVEVEKAKKKVLSNLDKNRLYYLNLLAGENNTTDKHDKYTSVKKDNTVDTFNKMKKAELKEAIKKIIVNTFQPSTGILIENRLQRMWEVGRAYPGYGKALKVEGERNKVTVEFHTGTSHLFEIDSESGIWKEVKTPIIENLDPEKYEYMDSLVTIKALQALRKAGAIIVRELEDENFEIRDILQFIVDNIKTEYGIN